MKLNPTKNLTPPQTSDEVFQYFRSVTDNWADAQRLMNDHIMCEEMEEELTGLKRPNPPTEEMIKRAQFVDKTYHWKNARIRSGD